MDTNSREGKAEAVVGAAGVLTAGGVITFGLFPLLLPTVVLLGALALPLLPLVLLGALFAGLYVAVRSVVRLALRGRRDRRPRSGLAKDQPETRTFAARGPFSPDSAS